MSKTKGAKGSNSTEYTALLARVNRQGSQLNKLAEALLAMQAPTAAKEIAEVRKDAEMLHDRLRLLMLRISTLTEVSFFARHKCPARLPALHTALIWAIDQDDTYWREREDKTIGEWVADVEAEMRLLRVVAA